MNSKQDPWSVSESDFPESGHQSEQLRFLLRYAILAPSSHNTQPWQFKISEDTVEVYPDRNRSLPVADPDDRELIISCGAAIFCLRIAIRYFGWDYKLNILPDPDTPDLLARIRLGKRKRSTMAEKTLFQMIRQRQTTRLPYENRLPPAALLDTLEAAAREENIWLHIVDGKDKQAIVGLIAEGDRIQMGQKKFRHELAEWIHPSHGTRRDGMPGYAFGLPSVLDFASKGLALAIRTFDMGNGVAADHEKLATGSPVLLVLGSDGENTAAWLATGMGLANVLLWGCAEGLTSSYLNQACEIADLRSRLANTIHRGGYPQLVLRMGYGPRGPRTPRRPLREVIM